MRFEESQHQEELKVIYGFLKDKGNFVPFIPNGGPYTYYRRGTGGVYLYRVLTEDFRLHRERKKHGGLKK